MPRRNRIRLALLPLEPRTTPAYAGGLAVAAGDMNGDGYTDLVTVPTQGPAHVKAVSGLDGTDLLSFYAFDPLFTGGATVAVGDLTGTGHADIVVGAVAGGGPAVAVFDGRTGQELFRFFAFEPTFAGGLYVATGDLGGTGRADIVVGAGVGGGPRVGVFDGRTGAAGTNFFAFDTSFRGGTSVAAGDVTGDGVDRIVTGAGPGGGPHVNVFDTPGGVVRTSIMAYRESYAGGTYLATGNVSDKGREDIIVSPRSGSGGSERTQMYDGLSGALDPDFFDRIAGSSSSTGVSGGWMGTSLDPDFFDQIAADQDGTSVAVGRFAGGERDQLVSAPAYRRPRLIDGGFAPATGFDTPVKTTGEFDGGGSPAESSPYAESPAAAARAPRLEGPAVGRGLRVKAETDVEGPNTLYFNIRLDEQPGYTVELYEADAGGGLGALIGTMTEGIQVGSDAAKYPTMDVPGGERPFSLSVPRELKAGTYHFAAVVDGDTTHPSLASVTVIPAPTPPPPPPPPPPPKKEEFDKRDRLTGTYTGLNSQIYGDFRYTLNVEADGTAELRVAGPETEGGIRVGSGTGRISDVTAKTGEISMTGIWANLFTPQIRLGQPVTTQRLVVPSVNFFWDRQPDGSLNVIVDGSDSVYLHE